MPKRKRVGETAKEVAEANREEIRRLIHHINFVQQARIEKLESIVTRLEEIIRSKPRPTFHLSLTDDEDDEPKFTR